MSNQVYEQRKISSANNGKNMPNEETSRRKITITLWDAGKIHASK